MSLPATRMSSVFPRSYTPAELEPIAASVRPCDMTPAHLERLQEAVTQYQWGTLLDRPDVLAFFPSSTNKGRRKLFKLISNLCAQDRPYEEIEAALTELDGPASQMLECDDFTNREKLRSAAELAWRKIPSRGPNPGRARRQYIGLLAQIFASVTGRRPGRRVHDKEYGPFLEFVTAALSPFKKAQGCEFEIREALKKFHQIV